MKKLIFRFYMWIFWKNFLWGLKSVLGHNTLSSSLKEMKNIEQLIQRENNLDNIDKITWENSCKTNREIFAKYMTLKHFNEVGELLAFFKAVDFKRIQA